MTADSLPAANDEIIVTVIGRWGFPVTNLLDDRW